MKLELENCPRCKRLFSKIQSPVCAGCMNDEEADYKKIRRVMDRQTGLSIAQVAEEAKVSLECVMRMLDTGLINTVDIKETPVCGRCGAPAISWSKRLCQGCLGRLEQECAQTIQQMQKKLTQKLEGELHDVHQMVNEKRGLVEDPRRKAQKTPEKEDSGRRMVIQERLGKKRKS